MATIGPKKPSPVHPEKMFRWGVEYFNAEFWGVQPDRPGSATESYGDRISLGERFPSANLSEVGGLRRSVTRNCPICPVSALRIRAALLVLRRTSSVLFTRNDDDHRDLHFHYGLCTWKTFPRHSERPRTNQNNSHKISSRLAPLPHQHPLRGGVDITTVVGENNQDSFL